MKLTSMFVVDDTDIITMLTGGYVAPAGSLPQVLESNGTVDRDDDEAQHACHNVYFLRPNEQQLQSLRVRSHHCFPSGYRFSSSYMIA